MRNLLKPALFAAVLVVTPVMAQMKSLPLVQLPVAATTVVDPADYRAAVDRAERGGTPLDIALAVAGAFEGLAQVIVQENDGGEAPSASRVIVLRDGLLDDSIRGERWEIALERSARGSWTIREVKRAWRCRRGGQQDRFAASRCP